MSAGLFGLLDDVAALTKLAAASVDDIGAGAGRATAKAAGVVIDDTAVTPQYVQGVTAERELPIIKRIALGSLRNKLIVILPGALLLSQFAPWLVFPVLMLGATYLCYEGAEKLWGSIRGHEEDSETLTSEDQTVSSAIRTDFILSAEIMVIALHEVAKQAFVPRLVILIVVALVITVLVYGVVAGIVKMDDFGLHLASADSRIANKFGRGLVIGMPKLLSTLSVVGTAAMLWVGGHILLVGSDHVGWHAPYEFVHRIEEHVHHAVGGVGGALAWLVNTGVSALIGVVVGGVVLTIVKLLHSVRHRSS